MFNSNLNELMTHLINYLMIYLIIKFSSQAHGAVVGLNRHVGLETG